VNTQQVEAFTDADFKVLRWIVKVCGKSGRLFASKPYIANGADVSLASVQRTLDKAVARDLLISSTVSRGRKGSQYDLSPRLAEIVTGEHPQPTHATDSQPTQDAKGSPPYYPPPPKRGGSNTGSTGDDLPLEDLFDHIRLAWPRARHDPAFIWIAPKSHLPRFCFC
jgi:hypothetical protein